MLHQLFRSLALLIVALSLVLADLGVPSAAAQGQGPNGAQRITIESPAPGTQVGSPVVIMGNVTRLPASAQLFYTVLSSDGRALGSGSFPIPGNPGEPASFITSLTFVEPLEGDAISLQLADQDPATGSMLAATALPLTVAPAPQRIVIETPGAGILVGNPVVLTGRTVRFPAAAALGYAIYASTGAQVGGGVFPVTGNRQEGGRFTASLGFFYPEQGGPLRIDLYDQDPLTGAFPATASLQVRTVALRQQVIIETPALGTQVGSPVVITGRTARYPIGGSLQYRISDSRGVALAGGRVLVAGNLNDPARFVASISFTPPAFSGPLHAEIFEVDERGGVTAVGVIDLRWGP
ncbi:MAG: Gmad2 immunoglobulin-like domain-containing protein [Chloroflexales bacterium]